MEIQLDGVVLVRLEAELACDLAPVARTFLAELTPGSDAWLSGEALVLDGPVDHAGTSIAFALFGIERARWWPPELGRLQAEPHVSVGTDLRSSKRVYFACAVIHSAEVYRRWINSDVVCRAIGQQMTLHVSDSRFH